LTVPLGVALGFAVAGHELVELYFVLLALLFYVYPVILQHWNGGRVLRLARQLE